MGIYWICSICKKNEFNCKCDNPRFDSFITTYG